MKEAAPQTTYEKLVAALLISAMIAIGWGPYGLSAMSLPFVDRFLIPVTMTFTLLTLSMLYEAAERFLGRGRGIYAAAIFCSLPATGLIASDPASLPTAAFMLIVSVGIWMAVRAIGDDHPFFLGMIGLLVLASGYFFRFDLRAIIFCFIGGLAGYQASAAKKRVWEEAGTLLRHLALPVVSIVLLYAAGAVIGSFFGVNVSLPQPVAVPVAHNLWRYLLPWLPWSLWLISIVPSRQILQAGSWKLFASAAWVLVLPVAAFRTKSPADTAAVAAPLMAFLAADWFHEEFVQSWTKRHRILHALPPMLTGFLLWTFAVLSATRFSPNKDLTILPVAVAIFIATGLFWTAWRNLPRWSFVLLFAAGVILGRLVAMNDPLFPTDQPAETLPLAPILLLIVASCAAAFGVDLFRRKSEHAGEPEREFRFAETNARMFSDPKRSEWAGLPVALKQPSSEIRSFVIFGDVTGAESPLSARRGGYFAFRALTRMLRETHPAFAVSLGDLASHATTGSYRKLRKLLGQIPVPLVVTPGNHDLFDHTVYNSAHFHALFGADNCAFHWGPIQFIVLNNAWGSLDDEQFEWLERMLAQPSSCKLVFCHKPPFDHRDGVFYGMEERPHAEKLHELLRAHRVSAVFSGHIHTLLSAERDGITYVVSGGAGSKLSSTEDQFHYLSARLESDALVIRALPLGGKSSLPLLELRFPV